MDEQPIPETLEQAEDRISVRITCGPWDNALASASGYPEHELMVEIYFPLWVVMNHDAAGLGSHIWQKLERLLNSPKSGV